MTASPTGDLGPAIDILRGAPPGWVDAPEVARDGLTWLVALPGEPRREVLTETWPRRVGLQIAAACVEPSWGAGTARDPMALLSAEAILLGWWCQAETVLVAEGLMDEAWTETSERREADPGLLDSELPPALCFLPAAETDAGHIPTPIHLHGGPPESLVAVLLIRDRPSLVAWDRSVADLFGQPAPEWPGVEGPRVWAAALWSGPDGRLSRSAGPVHGWDGDRWRCDHTGAATHPGGRAESASRLALALAGTIADDPGRVAPPDDSQASDARLAA